MEAIYFGTEKTWGFGSGNGPWIMADMENGLFSGSNAGLNSGDPTIADRFTTAMIEGEPNQWAILGGNAQSGGLSTFCSGVRPTGYNPMHKEGAIILGIGGDNSKSSAGTFYEGVMTSGYPSAATESAVQASIVSAGYAPNTAAAGRPGRSCPASAAPSAWTTTTAAAPTATRSRSGRATATPPRRTGPSTATAPCTIDGGCMDITGANYSQRHPHRVVDVQRRRQSAMAGLQRATGQPSVR